MPAQQIGDGGRAAAVRHVRELDAGHLLQDHGIEVLRGTDARRGVGHLARPRFRQREVLFDVLHRHRGMRGEHVGHQRQQRDVRQFARIVGQFLEQVEVQDLARQPAEGNGVAVRRGFRARFRANDAGGAAAVVHHDLHAEDFADLEGDDARDDVRGAAGGEGHDPADGLLRLPVLRRGRGRGQRRDGDQQEAREHGVSFRIEYAMQPRARVRRSGCRCRASSVSFTP